jgi:hypothetical protein
VAQQGVAVPADHGHGRDLRVPLSDGDDVSERAEACVVPGACGEPAGAAALQRPGVAQRGGETAVGFAYGQDHEFDRIAGGREGQRAVDELLRAAGGGLDQDVAAPQAYVLLSLGEPHLVVGSDCCPGAAWIVAQ